MRCSSSKPPQRHLIQTVGALPLTSNRVARRENVSGDKSRQSFSRSKTSIETATFREELQPSPQVINIRKVSDVSSIWTGIKMESDGTIAGLQGSPSPALQGRRRKGYWFVYLKRWPRLWGDPVHTLGNPKALFHLCSPVPCSRHTGSLDLPCQTCLRRKTTPNNNVEFTVIPRTRLQPLNEVPIGWQRVSGNGSCTRDGLGRRPFLPLNAFGN
jgi:hypothetical protein